MLALNELSVLCKLGRRALDAKDETLSLYELDCLGSAMRSLKKSVLLILDGRAIPYPNKYSKEV